MNRLEITRAGPLTSVQDAGRPGMLGYGVAASGPMDPSGFARAQAAAGVSCGAAVEFSMAGMAFTYRGGGATLGLAGGAFTASRNGERLTWPGGAKLQDGDMIDIRPGPWGNYGYARFDHEIDVPVLMGSRSTNVTVGLGGFGGRALRAGDALALMALASAPASLRAAGDAPDPDQPIRFIWGIHADMFSHDDRAAFCDTPFVVSPRIDRMGVRLVDNGIFAGQRILSLVSDCVVPGDVQVLGDGTPIILMADHQPTGGYPRIATIVGKDRPRVAQARPGASLRFAPISLDTARRLAL
ncbi:biotin-dependent carboxyltransferase family protein [Pelagibacterium montanilacus]|uniref:5-oxoprolinase subunit C family protein n=1 Tax=Pelagibacterium montanilacus TaxID=2185280 RepID=UPI000F8D8307|nr:biotin-dependent carboxyltransferase family protein [Pelagibacterium montanilacus]